MTRQRWFLSTSLSAALASMVLACVGVMGSRDNTTKRIEDELHFVVALGANARPRPPPFVLLLPLVGFGWGHWDRALSSRGLPTLAWVLVAWAVLQTRDALAQRRPRPRPGRSASGPGHPDASRHLSLRVRRPRLGGRVRLRRRRACGVGLYARCDSIDLLFAPGVGLEGRPLRGRWSTSSATACCCRWPVGRRSGPLPRRRGVIVWLLGALGVLGCYFAAPGVSGRREPGAVLSHSGRHARPGCGPPGGAFCIGGGFLCGGALAALGWLPRVCLVAFPLGWWVDRWLARWDRPALTAETNRGQEASPGTWCWLRPWPWGPPTQTTFFSPRRPAGLSRAWPRRQGGRRTETTIAQGGKTPIAGLRADRQMTANGMGLRETAERVGSSLLAFGRQRLTMKYQGRRETLA